MRRSSKGFTLVEVTIILLVLVILSGILLPTIERFIDLARYVKAKEDTGMIAAIIELWKVDNCSRFMKQDGTAGSPNSSANRVDMIVSLGAIATNSYGNAAPNGYWSEAIDLVAPGDQTLVVDTMDNQLVTGKPFGDANKAYYRPATTNPSECGFRGAYITGPVTPDPWGNRYMANVGFLGPVGTRNLGASTPPGFNQYDVFVLSAGANGIIETPFLVDGVVAGGDDMVALVSGGF